MRYEVCKDQKNQNVWRVDVIEEAGMSYTAYFVNPHAEQRAREFAASKNSSINMRAA